MASSSRPVGPPGGRTSRAVGRFGDGYGVAVCVWAAAVVTAGYLASKGRGVEAVATIGIIWAAIAVANTRWLVALCAMPALLIPATAIPADTIFGAVNPFQLTALLTIIVVGVSLTFERINRPTVWALAPALLLGVLGLVGGSLGSDFKTPGSIAVVWVGASALGSIASKDFSHLKGLLFVGAPVAVFTILECVGLPNYWNRLTGATLFATWPTYAGLHRAMGTFGHPLVASVVFAALALLATNLRKPRGIPWLAALYAVACLATLSRTGIVALAAGGAMMVLFPRESAVRGRAALWIAVALIGVVAFAASPLSASLGGRLQQQEQDNAGRVASLAILGHSLSTDPTSLLFGGGFDASTSYLESIGGNTATGLPDPDVFDNQLVTSVYNYGLLPLGLIVVFTFAAIAAAPARLRAVAMPPLVGTAVAFFFFDGLQWTSASFVLFFFVGMVCGFDRASTEHIRRHRAG